MRSIETHKINPANDRINIVAVDEPGDGGACHEYVLDIDRGRISVGLSFQNGPIGEVGVNGLTHEALLAVLIDRLEGFQNGPYACDENAQALTSLLAAQAALLSRTQRRIDAGIEGTHALDPVAVDADGKAMDTDEVETEFTKAADSAVADDEPAIQDGIAADKQSAETPAE